MSRDASSPRESSPSPGRASPLGRPRVHLRSTDSTNDRARALAIAGAPHGTLVTASVQTAGRGRQGRRWSAPAGSSLLASLVLRDPPPLLPLLAAVAVCDVAGPDARIKWPNDIVVSAPASSVSGGSSASDDSGASGAASGAGRAGLAKLAGILAEGRPQEGWAVLGIGVNVAVRLADLPAELRDDPAALAGGPSSQPAATLGKDPHAIEPTLESLLAALERWLGEPAAAVLDAWRARDALRGRDVAWAAHDAGGALMRGRAAGIDGTGRLVVALGDGRHATLDAGEVHLQL